MLSLLLGLAQVSKQQERVEAADKGGVGRNRWHPHRIAPCGAMPSGSCVLWLCAARPSHGRHAFISAICCLAHSSCHLRCFSPHCEEQHQPHVNSRHPRLCVSAHSSASGCHAYTRHRLKGWLGPAAPPRSVFSGGSQCTQVEDLRSAGWKRCQVCAAIAKRSVHICVQQLHGLGITVADQARPSPRRSAHAPNLPTQQRTRARNTSCAPYALTGHRTAAFPCSRWGGLPSAPRGTEGTPFNKAWGVHGRCASACGSIAPRFDSFRQSNWIVRKPFSHFAVCQTATTRGQTTTQVHAAAANVRLHAPRLAEPPTTWKLR